MPACANCGRDPRREGRDLRLRRPDDLHDPRCRGRRGDVGRRLRARAAQDARRRAEDRAAARHRQGRLRHPQASGGGSLNMSGQFGLLKTRRFAPFFGTQFLGAFNDNVFKNAFVILVTFHAARYAAGMNSR